MHSNGFVIALKNANKEVLRETNNGTVYLPFYSEYSLLLKNNNNRKAQVTIKIDGTNVLGNSFIILHPNESTDLERFIIDRNLNSGNKFKFVPKDDSRVADPSNEENGNIEVTFKLEKQFYPTIEINDKFPQKHWKSYRKDRRTDYSSSLYSQELSNNVMFCSTSLVAPSQAGATIEGSYSNQKFTYGTIGELEPLSTILKLKILAPVATTQWTVSTSTINETKKKYCTNCGKRLKFRDLYCNKCGTKQLHQFLEDF